MVLYLVYNIKKNIHNLSSFAACCGTQRIWPSAVTRRTAIITTHGMRRWRPRTSVGKRLPTRAEWEELCNLGSTWDDELRGYWFGGNCDSDYKDLLFLPAAGLCDISSGEVTTTRSYGFYWASSLCGKSNDYASSLYFNAGVVDPLNGGSYSSGFSVRCVQNK